MIERSTRFSLAGAPFDSRDQALAQGTPRLGRGATASEVRSIAIDTYDVVAAP